MATPWVEKYYCSMLREASHGGSRLQSAHEHPLTSFPVRTGTFCGGCQVQISEEEEEAYGCSECRFFLHEACAKAPLEIQSHPFHLQHPLYLVYDSSNKGTCHACGSLFPEIGYRCKDEEMQITVHLSCVISTMPCEDDDEKEEIRRRPSVMDHTMHPHQLSSYHSRTRTKIKCQKCYDPIPSGDYFGCPDCSFFLHESCAQPAVHAIQHYLHPEHTLTFAKLPDEKEHECPSCESPVRSDSYCYTCQVCDFFIHQTCASATLSDLEKGVGMTVQYSFHEHELKLYYDYYDSENCAVCDGTIGWEVPAYKCFSRGCKFKLHKSCAQLPSNLVHPSHSLHPLTLCFKPPSADTVCRRCSAGIRDTFAFSCGECNFYLHVDCAQKPTLKHPFHEHSLLYFATADSYEGLACSACRKSCSVDLFSLCAVRFYSSP